MKLPWGKGGSRRGQCRTGRCKQGGTVPEGQTVLGSEGEEELTPPWEQEPGDDAPQHCVTCLGPWPGHASPGQGGPARPTVVLAKPPHQ